MKVLLINKFLFSFGGTETALFQHAQLLQQHGHEVIYYSMAHPKNRECRQAPYFPPRVDFEEMPGWRQRVRGVKRILFGRDAQAGLDGLLRAERPDIAHLHNIYHHLSPAIIATLKKHGVPVVMTLHDYKVVCPAYKLFRRGETCERCRQGRFFHCLLNRCVKESYWKSLVALLEAELHRRHYRLVDRFVCPSGFLLEKVGAMGFPGPGVMIGNFAWPPPQDAPPTPPAPQVVFFGRLVEEKGVPLLIDAMSGIDADCLIVGDGPLRDVLRARAAANPRIKFLAHQPFAELERIVRGSSMVVVPSVWYENNPFAIIESFALGVPVVAARIGGIPELVTDGETGLLFAPGDSADLRDRIVGLLQRPELGRELAGRARRRLERHFSPARHGDELLGLYRDVIATTAARSRD
jgi:glycosyltransferase involved in cell wall biosynthesis